MRIKIYTVLFLTAFFLPAAILGLSVDSTDPAGDSGGISLDSNITAVFDAELDTNVGSYNDIIEFYRITDNLGEDLPLPIRLFGQGSISDSTLTFDPDINFLAGHRHKVILTTNIEDASHNPLPNAYEWHFTSVYDRTEENIIIASDGKTRVVIPADALASNGHVDINLDPVNSPVLVSQNDILTANSAIASSGDPHLYPINSTMKEFIAYEGSSTLYGDKDLNGAVTVYLPFQNSDSDRYTDGTSPPVLTEFLEAYYMDTTAKRWVKINNINIDAVNNIASANVAKLSIFVLMGHSAPGLKDSYAFPVPFMPNDNPNHTAITFTKLVPYAQIRIFTITAKPVQEFQADYLGSDISWDARNSNGQTLASGMYIYKIRRGRDAKTGRLVIIR